MLLVVVLVLMFMWVLVMVDGGNDTAFTSFSVPRFGAIDGVLVVGSAGNGVGVNVGVDDGAGGCGATDVDSRC